MRPSHARTCLHCDQIGLFLKDLFTNLLTKVAQISVEFWGYLKNVNIYIKTAAFWAAFVKNWATLNSTIWSHWRREIEIWKGICLRCRHSSVVSSETISLLPWVRAPITTCMILSIEVYFVQYLSLHYEKNENKRWGLGPLKKSLGIEEGLKWAATSVTSGPWFKSCLQKKMNDFIYC